MKKAIMFLRRNLRLPKHPSSVLKRCEYLVNRFYHELKTNGAKSAFLKLLRFIEDKIDKRYTYTIISNTKEIQDNIRNFKYKPLVSIIMPVYNTDPKWLAAAIRSVRKQFYENWELCIVDDASRKKHIREILGKHSIQDGRIKTRVLNENKGIAGASNEALSISTGEFVGLLDHDDELTPDALYESVKAINETRNDLFYSDEDHVVGNREYIMPHYKPDYSPDLIFSQNYICHFLVCRKSIIDKIGGFRKGFEGSQDHDLILRILEKTNKVHHIPKVLYHWREHSNSTAGNPNSKPLAWEAGKKAVEEALKRRKVEGEVYFGKSFGVYRVKREIISNPLVSIVIPYKDKPEFLKRCLDSVLNKSSYTHYEIIGINNNSDLEETLDLTNSYMKLDKRIRFFTYDAPFNYSAINNFGVKLARGTHVVLMNNDIEIISCDWMEALLEHSQRSEVGVVGAKLYYPDNTIQHAGMILGHGAATGHSHYHYNGDSLGYFCRLISIQNVSAVTGALMMIKKELYEKFGGLNEIDFPIAYNDADLCIRLLEKGHLNVFTPYCEAYHHESISRGYDDAMERLARFIKETEAFKKTYKRILDKGDPYYNPNLTLTGQIWDTK